MLKTITNQSKSFFLSNQFVKPCGEHIFSQRNILILQSNLNELKILTYFQATQTNSLTLFFTLSLANKHIFLYFLFKTNKELANIDKTLLRFAVLNTLHTAVLYKYYESRKSASIPPHIHMVVLCTAF